MLQRFALLLCFGALAALLTGCAPYQQQPHSAYEGFMQGETQVVMMDGHPVLVTPRPVLEQVVVVQRPRPVVVQVPAGKRVEVVRPGREPRYDARRDRRDYHDGRY